MNVYYDFDSYKWLDGETHKEIPHERWLTSASKSLWPVQPYTPIYLTAGLSFIKNETSDFFQRIPDEYFERISEEIENNCWWRARHWRGNYGDNSVINILCE